MNEKCVLNVAIAQDGLELCLRLHLWVDIRLANPSQVLVNSDEFLFSEFVFQSDS